MLINLKSRSESSKFLENCEISKSQIQKYPNNYKTVKTFETGRFDTLSAISSDGAWWNRKEAMCDSHDWLPLLRIRICNIIQEII